MSDKEATYSHVKHSLAVMQQNGNPFSRIWFVYGRGGGITQQRHILPFVIVSTQLLVKGLMEDSNTPHTGTTGLQNTMVTKKKRDFLQSLGNQAAAPHDQQWHDGCHDTRIATAFAARILFGRTTRRFHGGRLRGSMRKDKENEKPTIRLSLSFLQYLRWERYKKTQQEQLTNEAGGH